MTFDQLTEFAERMRTRAKLASFSEERREYEQMAEIVEELIAAREQFGAVSDTRFLLG